MGFVQENSGKCKLPRGADGSMERYNFYVIWQYLSRAL